MSWDDGVGPQTPTDHFLAALLEEVRGLRKEISGFRASGPSVPVESDVEVVREPFREQILPKAKRLSK